MSVCEDKDTESYERGVALAKDWIKGGGSLDADGPDTKDEALYNGFIDTLAEERRKKS